MKKVITVSLALILCIALFAACGGGGGSTLQGKFVDPENSENWVEFESGGKVTTSLEGTVFEGTFTVDGDKVTCTMTFMGAESVEEYVLSNDGKTLTDQSWFATVYHLE